MSPTTKCPRCGKPFCYSTVRDRKYRGRKVGRCRRCLVSDGCRLRQEIHRLIALGENAKSIAYALRTSAKNIEYHRARLMRELNTFTVAGLTRIAIRSRLVNP